METNMTKPKKNKNKPIHTELSIREFKVWLDGLCSFNDADWTPNLAQWSLIKSKLMNLKESETTQPYKIHPSPNTLNNLYPMPITNPPVVFDDLSPEQLAQKIEKAKTQGPAIKTPHVDSSTGYRSSYD